MNEQQLSIMKHIATILDNLDNGEFKVSDLNAKVRYSLKGYTLTAPEDKALALARLVMEEGPIEDNVGLFCNVFDTTGKYAQMAPDPFFYINAILHRLGALSTAHQHLSAVPDTMTTTLRR